MDVVRRLGPGTFLTVLIGCISTIVIPHVTSLFGILQISVFVVMAILALSLSLTWGFAGILCLGQAAFFGLGGYSYAIAAENIGDSTIPILLSVLVPAIVALALGYFMFAARLGELYIGVITLSFSLILFNFFNSASGPSYVIGEAKINGFTGMSSVPMIKIPGLPQFIVGPEEFFYLAMGSLIAVYLLCKLLTVSTFGRIVIAVRQNEDRAELIGYNGAAFKIAIFVIGAAIAGYAGCLFTNWNSFVSPTVFSLGMTAQTIIWIIVGGRETFVGPILGSVMLQYITTKLGTSGLVDSSLVLGAILMIFVLLIPEGFVPFVAKLINAVLGAVRQKPADQVLPGEKRGESLA